MKNVVITGPLRGIGKAAAELFLQAGYSVCGMGRSGAEEARAILPYENFVFVQGDVANSADRDSLVNTAMEKFGRIDVLVNVAGVAPNVRADLLDMTEESYDRVMGINTKGLMFLTQACARNMLQNQPEEGIRGYICNVSSLSAYAPSVNRGEYCISKAGVSMITKLFASRLAESGIPVNEVRPGIIATDMTSKVKEKYDTLIADGLLPMPRWGTPEDVAKAIFRLCDGSLPYITGQSVDVDGGFHLKRL